MVQRLDRLADLLGPAGGGDRPAQSHGVQSMKELPGARQRPWISVQLAVDLAGAAVDLLRQGRADSLACCLCHDSREAPAVRTNELRDLAAICRNPEFLKCLKPRR